MEFIAGPTELRALARSGMTYEVLQADLASESAGKLSPVPANALGFGYGSMGGYYTFTEVLAQLDSMKLLYPDLVRARQSIGSSVEGRGIWAVKISDNPDAEEAGEPEVLYTGLHHAREPEGMMTVIYYMWWLLENYGSDLTATYLVNNRQMWFIPVVNPDGYVYNETTNPTGGGFWRKNRRNNGGGTYGVDLNRNYGPYESWNAPNGGSSTSPGSDTYRGTNLFSEPETQTIADFVGSHSFKTCLNYHTYGNYLIFPFGYLGQESDDSLTFREFAFDMVAENRYNSGRDLQTVGYSTRGNSDDYLYGDFSKPPVFAMTPEVGSSFWPSTDQILPLAQQNLKANIYYSYVAGDYTVVKRFDAGTLLPGGHFSVKTVLRNKGLGDISNVHVAVSSASPTVVFDTSSALIPSFIPRTDQEIYFGGHVLPYGGVGLPISVYITVTTPGGYFYCDTEKVAVGDPDILLSDSGNGGISNWNTGWGITSDAHSAPWAFTDSPAGTYAASTSNSLTTLSGLDLTGYGYCVLRYWTKWAIQPRWDFGVVEASSDGGTVWTVLQSPLSHPTSAHGAQSGLDWGYDGYTPGLDWVEDEVDLSGFLGQPVVHVRFRVVSDAADQRDGWYLDDIRVLAYRSALQLSGLRVSDGGTGSDELVFGESPSATDGLDAGIEEELGPRPPSGTFDVRWNISATNGTKTDLRDIVTSVSPPNVFTAELQAGSGGYPFSFSWNPRGFLPGGWHIRDGETHGSKFIENMWADTGFTVTDSSVHSVEIVHTSTDTISDTLTRGWNLVSLPVAAYHVLKSELFPGASSHAFAYEGVYKIKDTLENRKGYWIKDTGEVVAFKGAPVVEDTIDIPGGWSLLSSVSLPLTRSHILAPSNAFIFRGSYSLLEGAKTLKPGEAFWLKGPATAILSPYAIASELKPAGRALADTLSVTDAGGRSTKLFFERGTPGDLASGLPPVPPPDAFDARFQSGTFAERVSPGTPATILLQGAFPMRISWSIARPFTLSVPWSGESRSLEERGSMELVDPRMTSLILGVGSDEPAAFALSQNYPNPFNPSTVIRFDVPVRSRVRIDMFDILGRTVEKIVQEREFAAGRYSAEVDGSALAGGVYVYRMEARPLDGRSPRSLTKKMILLK